MQEEFEENLAQSEDSKLSRSKDFNNLTETIEKFSAENPKCPTRTNEEIRKRFFRNWQVYIKILSFINETDVSQKYTTRIEKCEKEKRDLYQEKVFKVN